MKSVKNHLSLIVALLSILASIQIFTIVDRSIDAYKNNLTNNYSVIIVSQKTLKKQTVLNINSLIANSTELTPDNVIKRLNNGMNKDNIELLKLSLPRFYKLQLKQYPTPSEITKLTKDLFSNSAISKVEDYANVHDTTYKLLILFKNVVSVFSIIVLIVTVLLILKELKIWQFNHSERMSIMGLFGAPVWLRSAVLFRLAIVDAIIAAILAFVGFSYISTNEWMLNQFANIDIDVVIFDSFNDFGILLATSMFVSILLASLIVITHKEEI